MEIKKVDEKFPGISAANNGFSDGITIAALASWLAIDMANWKKMTAGTAALWGSAIAGLGLIVGVMRYNVDKKTEAQYEAAARSNNNAIDAIIQLKAENDQLREGIDIERKRFTDLITSKHSARAEHSEHAPHASNHEAAASEHAAHNTHHEDGEHANHAQKHAKSHASHAEKATAEKQEAAEAQLSV